MNISKALSIEGWMAENELICLAELATKSSNIAEIGSWMGRSTAALAANTKGTVHAIDTWAGSAESAHKNQLIGRSPDWLINTFKENMSEFSNIVIHQMSSYWASKYFIHSKFDLIFIDAGHSYEEVKTDIAAWRPLLSEGGIICGHDYTSGWPGVIQAVEEEMQTFNVIGTIWIAD